MKGWATILFMVAVGEGGGGGLLAVGWAGVSMPKYNRSPQGGG